MAKVAWDTDLLEAGWHSATYALPGVEILARDLWHCPWDCSLKAGERHPSLMPGRSKPE